MTKHGKFYDHKLSHERPFLLEYFPEEKKIPLNSIDMHPTIHLGILLKGQIRMWVDGFEKKLEAGDCWLTNPLEPHTALEQSPEKEAIVATFLLEEMGQGFAGWSLPVLVPFSVDASSRHEVLSGASKQELLRLGGMLRDSLRKVQDCYGQFQQWLQIHSVYCELLRQFENPSTGLRPSELDRIRPALLLPRQHPGTPVSLEDAAQACSLSPGRFGELFRKNTGTTFGQYETKFRLSGARNDVLSGTRTLKEIAADWGFYDESHFLKIFRKIYGFPPKEYRARYLQSRGRPIRK